MLYKLLNNFEIKKNLKKNIITQIARTVWKQCPIYGGNLKHYNFIKVGWKLVMKVLCECTDKYKFG